MAKIRIVCVGKIKEAFFQEGIKDCMQAVRRRFPAEIVEYPDEPTPDKAGEELKKRIINKEGERILSGISREDYVTALCIDGTQYSTKTFARRFTNRMKTLERSGRDYVFVIGGSLGLSEAVIERADEKLSFSSLTFPHQMMRLILCEQIAKAASQ